MSQRTKRLINSLSEKIEILEETHLTSSTWLLIFFSIVVIRNILESFSGEKLVFDYPSFFLHFPLAYIAPLFTLVILLSVLSKVRVERVTRLMLFVWMLTLLPPVLDLLFGRGEGKRIGYLPIGPGGFLPTLISFFNPKITLEGTTPGIRLEALLASLLGAVYVFLRSRSILRTLVTPFFVFFTSFIFFTLPYNIVNLAYYLNPELGSVAGLYSKVGVIQRQPWNLVSFSTALLDSLFVLPIISCWFYLYSREKFLREIRLIAWLPSAWYISMTFLGLILGWRRFAVEVPLHPFDILSILALILAIFFAYQFCNKLNRLEESSPKVINFIYLSFSLLFAGCVNYTPLIFVFLFIAFGLLYGLPPIALRRFPILSHFTIGMASLSASAIGFSAFTSNLTPNFLPYNFILILLLAIPLGLLSRDLPDWAEKKLGNIPSGGLLLISFLLVSLLLDSFLLTVSSIVLSIFGFLRLKERVSRMLFWANSSIYGSLSCILLLRGLSPADPGKTPETIVHFYQGTFFERNLMWDHAVIEFEKAVQKGWEEDKAFLSLGICHQEEGRFEESARWYRRALEANPRLVPAYNNLGLVLRRLGDYESSLKVLKEGLKIDPGSARLHYNLFLTLQSKGEMEELLSRITTYLQLNPKDTRAREILGDLYLRREEPEKALREFEEILIREPRNQEILTKSGIAHLQAGDEPKAIKRFEQAISRDPKNIIAHLNLGYIYANQGSAEKAIQRFERVLHLSPESVDAHHRLGYIFLERAMWDSSLYHFRRCLELEPTVANHYDSMGELFLKKGEWKEASEWYHKALEIDSMFPNPYFMLATIAKREGREREAKNLFQTFIQLETSLDHPNQEKIEKAKEYLEEMS